jgi:hypothetical protein
MSKKVSKTLASLHELPASRYKNRPFENLKPAQQAEWDEIVEAIRSGQLDHLSLVDIKRTVCESFGIEVCMSTFRRHLGLAGVEKYRS